LAGETLVHRDDHDTTLGAAMAALADPSRRKIVADLLFDPLGIERT
jgi:hypothetical protein